MLGLQLTHVSKMGPRWISDGLSISLWVPGLCLLSMHIKSTGCWSSIWTYSRCRLILWGVSGQGTLSQLGITDLTARFMGPRLGLAGVDRTQVGPMLAPWTLLSGRLLTHLPLDEVAAVSQTTYSNALFLHEKVWIVTKISLKFVPKGPIDNNPTFV